VTSYPSATDYQLALQHPDYAFQLDSLRQAELDQQGAYGPRLASGTTAVVFRAVTPGSGQALALRCYTREVPAARQRYAALGRYVSQHQLTEQVGKVTWHDDAVRVSGATWPVLQMDWIDGRVLDVYMGYLVETGRTDALSALAQRWRSLVRELQGAQFAHGDLQHGNVIVDQGGALRLVDFDAAWIPTLTRAVAPDEIGHPNYQHPGRQAEASWGRWGDTFAGLVIYLSLVALARDPGLWTALHNEDNLLFERRDFSAPFDTEVWKRLDHLGDREVARLADKLRECCAAQWEASCGLDQLIDPWWQKTRAEPVAQAAATATAAQQGAPPPPPPMPSPPMPSPTMPPAAQPQSARAGGWWQSLPSSAPPPTPPEPPPGPALPARWAAVLVIAAVLLITGLAAGLPGVDVAGLALGAYPVLRWLARASRNQAL
jgi:hypothetical protein